MNRNAIVLCLTLIFVTGCGGNSSDPAEPLFSGTVSSTTPIVEPQVTLKNPAGEVFTASIDDRGIFSLPDALVDDQYLMRVDIGNNNYLYSIAHLTKATANRQNIHSYTDLVARAWFADLNTDIFTAFTGDPSIANFPSAEAIAKINANVQAIVSDVLEVYGLTGVPLSTARYERSDTGVDRFLNENPVIIKNNRATIIVNDPQTNLQSIAVNNVELQTTFGGTDSSPPSQPENLRALGAGEDAITLAWSIATDNIGITTYDIYRNDALINHTPFPVYRDTNVTANTEYSYTVVARDEANNSSTPSVAAIGSTLTSLDIEAPDAPSSATLEASTQSINVYWSHSNPNDLVSFQITRTGPDGIIVREVTSTRINDIIVASGTEYCYTVVAVDASGNRSEENPSTCITTSGATIEPLEADETITLATIEMAQESSSSPEGSTAVAFVNRLGDSSGEISIDYVITAGTATADEDYIATDGTLVWADGDTVAKRIEIELLADDISEEAETLQIVLTNSSVNAVVLQASTVITITAN